MIEPPPPARSGPTDVVVEFEGPEPQRRVTVAFRIILAIPHLLFAGILGLVAEIVIVLAWFAALFTARVPEGMATFIGNVIQYVARVYAYAGYLMTDKFPSFSLDDPDGSVAVRYSPDRLNRAAVLFRLILLIPGFIVIQILSYGLFIASFVIWLIVLIAGRLPTSLWQAEAAALRYQVRFYAFASMLSTAYPRGLFGDGEAKAPAPVADDWEPTPLPARPRVASLLLSRAAKRLLILFIVLGSVFQVGTFAAGMIAALQTSETYDAVTAAFDDLDAEVNDFFTTAQGCAVQGGAECIHSANNRLADAFVAFRNELRAQEYEAAAAPIAEEVDADVGLIIDALRRLATINDVGQYQAAAAELQGLLQQFGADYDDLVFTLRF